MSSAVALKAAYAKGGGVCSGIGKQQRISAERLKRDGVETFFPMGTGRGDQLAQRERKRSDGRGRLNTQSSSAGAPRGGTAFSVGTSSFPDLFRSLSSSPSTLPTAKPSTPSSPSASSSVRQPDSNSTG